MCDSHPSLAFEKSTVGNSSCLFLNLAFGHLQCLVPECHIIDPERKTRLVTNRGFSSYRPRTGKANTAISHSHLVGILRVSCWCVPRLVSWWYPDYTWPYLGIIQSPVSCVSILPYLAAYPATYPGVTWAYLYHIFKLDVGAETRTVQTTLASSIQIANKLKIALL